MRESWQGIIPAYAGAHDLSAIYLVQDLLHIYITYPFLV